MLREQAPAGFTSSRKQSLLAGGGLRALCIDYDQNYDSDQDFVGFDEVRAKA